MIKKLGPLLIFPAAEKEAAKMGRPSLRTPETVAKICATIREYGYADAYAAAEAGVSSSAVSRWRQEDEEFAVQLDAARTEYLGKRLKEIEGVRKRDGSIDWRAQKWLMQAAAPEVYGTPSRRFSLAREKEERQRAQEKEEAENPEVLTPADLAQYQKWRRYSIERMNGVGEEEALWIGHFSQHPTPPVFPGSLAIAGAEPAPEPDYTPEERAQLAAIRERTRVARAAMAREDEEKRRQLARERGELVEEEEEGEAEPVGDQSADGGAQDGKESGPSVLSAVEGSVLSAVEGRPRPELQDAANVPESRRDTEEGGDLQNTTNLPESRGTVPDGETRGEGALRHRSGPVAPTPWTGATPGVAAETAERVAYYARLVAENEERKRGAAGGGRLEPLRAELEKMARNTPRPAVPQARRPLTGAARAAAEAKEWRRINQLVEAQFQRDADRAMAVAEAAHCDALPGMWAGF